MLTSTIRVHCPSCQSNDYQLQDLQLIDNELHAAYTCDKCGCRYVDAYALLYLGGRTDSMHYDRDNLVID